jgi:hypothetical protein
MRLKGPHPPEYSPGGTWLIIAEVAKVNQWLYNHHTFTHYSLEVRTYYPCLLLGVSIV